MWQGLAGQVFLKPHTNLLPRCSGFDRPPVNWEEECCYGGLVITWQLATGSPWTNGHFDVSSQCCLMIEPSATFQNAKIEWKEKHRLIWACIDIVVHFRVQMASCWKNAFWPSCIVFLARRTTLGKKKQTVAGFSTFAGRPSQPLRWRDFASPKFGLSPVKWRFWGAYGACMYTSVNSLPHCKKKC